jgi:hypothetical protein
MGQHHHATRWSMTPSEHKSAKSLRIRVTSEVTKNPKSRRREARVGRLIPYKIV